MRVMVTGGAGFIGSHVVDAFLAGGSQVTVIDDLSAGRLERIEDRAEFVKADITDAGLIASAVREWQPDLICHLAARVSVGASVADPAGSVADIAGTVNVLEAAREAAARVIFASSGGALYGSVDTARAAEDSDLAPESPYGTAKMCAEHYVMLYNRMHGTRHAVLRLANVYGPRQYAGVISVFCTNVLAGGRLTIYGDGTQTRDYVHVSDAARAFTAAASRHEQGIWNIGTGIRTSVLRLVTVIREITGREVITVRAAPRPGEIMHSCLAPGLAAAELGWHPGVPLSDGVRDVCRWIEWKESGRP